jgi:hypothetical protein
MMDESGAEVLAELRRHYRGAREAVAGHMFGLGMDGVTAPSVETALYRMYEVGLVHGHGDCPQVGPSDVLADPGDPGVSHYTASMQVYVTIPIPAGWGAERVTDYEVARVITDAIKAKYPEIPEGQLIELNIQDGMRP